MNFKTAFDTAWEKYQSLIIDSGSIPTDEPERSIVLAVWKERFFQAFQMGWLAAANSLIAAMEK